MGTIEDKIKLSASQLGIDAATMREILNIDAKTLPCIYLLILGYVKDLRKSMNIDPKYDDEDLVSRYGFTKDLQRRINEHIATFSGIEGCNLTVKHYSYIDPQYMSAAESDVREYVTSHNMNLEYGKHEELFIIPKTQLKTILKQYQMIGKSYMGHISELVTKIKELETEIEIERKNHVIELERKDRVLERKNHEFEMTSKNHEFELASKNHEFELASKNHELAMIKYELANQKMAAELLMLKSKNNQETIPIIPITPVNQEIPQLKQKNKPVTAAEPETKTKPKIIKKAVKKNTENN